MTLPVTGLELNAFAESFKQLQIVDKSDDPILADGKDNFDREEELENELFLKIMSSVDETNNDTNKDNNNVTKYDTYDNGEGNEDRIGQWRVQLFAVGVNGEWGNIGSTGTLRLLKDRIPKRGVSRLVFRDNLVKRVYLNRFIHPNDQFIGDLDKPTLQEVAECLSGSTVIVPDLTTRACMIESYFYSDTSADAKSELLKQRTALVFQLPNDMHEFTKLWKIHHQLNRNYYLPSKDSSNPDEKLPPVVAAVLTQPTSSQPDTALAK
jgi:hypothetical protein